MVQAQLLACTCSFMQFCFDLAQLFRPALLLLAHRAQFAVSRLISLLAGYSSGAA
jgi:hypothetical protein